MRNYILSGHVCSINSWSLSLLFIRHEVDVDRWVGAGGRLILTTETSSEVGLVGIRLVSVLFDSDLCMFFLIVMCTSYVSFMFK